MEDFKALLARIVNAGLYKRAATLMLTESDAMGVMYASDRVFNSE